MNNKRLTILMLVFGTLALASLTAGVIARDHEMAKSVKTLCEQAAAAIDAKDWPAAFDACQKLQARKGGPALAHAYRGKAYEDQGKLSEADVEYTASYGLGNHVASVSVMRVRKKARG